MELSHIHGTGDFFQADSYWSPARRRDLSRIYWAARCREALQPAIEANPEYAHVEHVQIDVADVHPRFSRVPTTYFEAGIHHRRPFVGSSFLRHTLASIDHLHLWVPDRYYFITPSTPFNFDSVRIHRDMKVDEWGPLIAELDRRHAYGLVVNSSPGSIPESPRLINFQGKTTISEAVEILKRADGYFGVDTCFAILAAQLFPADQLWVRTRNPWLLANRWTYYATHDSYSWLVPAFGEPAHPDPGRPALKPGMVVVQLTVPVLLLTRHFSAGDLVEVEPAKARVMIARGHAAPHEPDRDGHSHDDPDTHDPADLSPPHQPQPSRCG
jgi:hypothetical protein